MKRTWIYCPLALLAWSVLVGPRLFAQEPPATASPQLTRAQMEEFLLNAKVVKRETLPIGVTASERATLTDGRLTHDAHIQTVEIYKTRFESDRGMELNFRDSYKFNIAAYRLDKLLGLNMVPVSVERKIGGTTASVTWWVDDFLMMDLDRHQEKIKPPKPALWVDQMHQVRIFTQLVYNTDPNLGNLLITKDWTLWMIDFTRAFRLHKKLQNVKSLFRIDRRFYNGLRELKEDVLMQELDPYLRKAEIKAVLARRDEILRCFDEKIAQKSEAAVICSRPGH
ncbi:hypothetical protein MYX84_05225 [Acidobacteria bacterium AH-259-O06]|nr:hypothetical protein [Acidobacteria bacterium AH-259-O06]